MDKRELINAVFEMDSEELNQVVYAIQERRNILARMAKLNFSVGDRVRFTDRTGRIVHGTVTKIMQKNVKVQQDDRNTTWTVTPTLLDHTGEE